MAQFGSIYSLLTRAHPFVVNQVVCKRILAMVSTSIISYKIKDIKLIPLPIAVLNNWHTLQGNDCVELPESEDNLPYVQQVWNQHKQTYIIDEYNNSNNISTVNTTNDDNNSNPTRESGNTHIQDNSARESNYNHTDDGNNNNNNDEDRNIDRIEPNIHPNEINIPKGKPRITVGCNEFIPHSILISANIGLGNS